LTTDIGALAAIATVPDENPGVKIDESLLQQRLTTWARVTSWKLSTPIARINHLGRRSYHAHENDKGKMSQVEADAKSLYADDMPEVVALVASTTFATYFDWSLIETKQ